MSTSPLGSAVPATRDGGVPLLRDALAALRTSPRRLSPKYFYDSAGSALFDEICELPEYYPTRTERAILEAQGTAIAARLVASGPCRVVEPGAGSSTKTRLLLRALGPRCLAYVPVDIAGEHLELAAARLREELPWLDVAPITADFSAELPVPSTDVTARTVVYFPGSTLGNFEPDDARALLARFRRVAGREGHVLLGVDLKKDPAILHAAYNDARGVTAAFNKNVLRRMNAELGADFVLDAFHHYAFFAPVPGRIEMHLVSARRQVVHLADEAFVFEEGETICTEHSYKYGLADIERLVRSAGLALVDSWLDDKRWFAVLLLRPAV